MAETIDAEAIDAEAGGEEKLAPTLRRCIVTRQALEKPAMIRFVLDPEGRVVPDLKEKLPGRGLWVTAERAILAQAVAKNAFAKAAKQSAKVAPDLVERVAELAKREVAELLGLARKSGHLVAGFEKVQAALDRDGVRVLIAASDGAEDGRRKLARRAGWDPRGSNALAAGAPASGLAAGSGVEICAPLTADELARALGRDHAVHAAIRQSGIAERIITACRRLAGLDGSLDGGLGGGNGGAGLTAPDTIAARPAATTTN
jgi:predicted RNA-binding protein YlxR (DUF448 family)